MHYPDSRWRPRCQGKSRDDVSGRIKAIISAISFSEEDSHYNKYNLYHLSGTNTLFNHV